MASEIELAQAYITQRNSILVKWRKNLNQSNAHTMFDAEKPKMSRKLRSIFPRGKHGKALQESLTYYTN